MRLGLPLRRRDNPMGTADHADDLDELSLADVFEDLINDTGVELHPPAQLLERKFAGEIEYLQGQVFEQVNRDARLLDGFRLVSNKSHCF